jgi:hypothetical protein
MHPSLPGPLRLGVEAETGTVVVRIRPFVKIKICPHSDLATQYYLQLAVGI